MHNLAMNLGNCFSHDPSNESKQQRFKESYKSNDVKGLAMYFKEKHLVSECSRLKFNEQISITKLKIFCAVNKVLRVIYRLSDEHERDLFPVINAVSNSYWIATSLNILIYVALKYYKCYNKIYLSGRKSFLACSIVTS